MPSFWPKEKPYRASNVYPSTEGEISWNGNVYRELTFTPLEDDASFSLEDVTIGINFHWERQETQTFLGTLRLVVDEGKITAINQVPAEDYLTSVISSEMNATSSLEFLKAHAVISRSWLLAQIEKRKALGERAATSSPSSRLKQNTSAGTTAKTIPSSTYAPTTIANAIRALPVPPTRVWWRP